MKKKEVKKYFKFCDDMINIFSDYAFKLDKYFSNEDNKILHQDLFFEYQVLKDDLNSLIERGEFIKK